MPTIIAENHPRLVYKMINYGFNIFIINHLIEKVTISIVEDRNETKIQKDFIFQLNKCSKFMKQFKMSFLIILN